MNTKGLDMHVQTLDDVEQTIRGYVNTQKRKHNPTLHGIFGNIRSQKRYSFIGDYPLLHTCLVALAHMGMPVKAQTVLSCVNRHSTELGGSWKGKKYVMEELYKTL